MGLIRIAAAVITRADGRFLLVRKQGTAMFMQPGGKIEPLENPSDALIRELSEELGLTVAVPDLTYLGQFEAPAAHEAGFLVQAEMFKLRIEQKPVAGGEIVEIIWIEPTNPHNMPLAPLTAQFGLGQANL